MRLSRGDVLVVCDVFSEACGKIGAIAATRLAATQRILMPGAPQTALGRRITRTASSISASTAGSSIVAGIS
jgi:hypothetical protein